MSAHDEHHAHQGGHELDSFDTGMVFKLVFGLSALTFLACILVAELFYRQNSAIQEERADQAANYVLRQDLNAQMQEETKGLDKVIDAIVSAPELLKAQAPPAGWIHPDDVGKAAEKPAE